MFRNVPRGHTQAALQTCESRPDRAAKRVGGRQSNVGITLIVGVPLLIAIGGGVLGFFELRSALSFDLQAMRAVALQSSVLRLAVENESSIRGYAASGQRPDLQHYLANAGRMNPELAELSAATLDIGIADGPRMVNALDRLYAHWTSAVAAPTARRPASVAQSHAARTREGTFIDTYRMTDRRLGDAISRRIVDHTSSFAVRFTQIALLFLMSVVMCILGVALAAGQLLLVDRERLHTESLLREREMLYARDRAWSNSFQRAVLPPRLPAVAGCRFDAVYEPGESDAHVGGDWYDAVRLSDGRILISIGDVAGSGLEAAVVMGIVRQIMRGIAQVHANPALMLDAADRALRLERSDVFVTAWVGVLDLVSRTLSYASAGHPPALLGYADGSVIELSDTALPLGLRQGHAGTATTIEIVDGATLLLYTDGLSEATRDVIAGDALVRAAAARLATGPWRAPASEVHEDVLANPPADDVAILVARIDLEETEQYLRRLTFDVNDAAAARHARGVFLATLTERGFGPIESLNAELVFGELIGNVVRHAPGRGDVEIAIDCSGPQTVLHVFDRGPGFRHTSRLPSDIFAESGRGLFLIDAMTDDFSVAERRGGGSHARAVLIGRSNRPLRCDEMLVPEALCAG